MSQIRFALLTSLLVLAASMMAQEQTTPPSTAETKPQKPSLRQRRSLQPTRNLRQREARHRQATLQGCAGSHAGILPDENQAQGIGHDQGIGIV